MKQTAYHEAAHAVSGQRFNFFVYHVTIVPHENTAGCVNTLDGDHYRFVDGVEELDPDKCRDCIIHALAGYITSVRDCKSFGEMRRARLLAWDDFVGAREVLRSLGQTSLKPYFKLTRDFVRREWTAIEAVANALLDRKTLDDTEVEIIVAIADGDETAAEDLARYRLLKAG